MRSKVLLEKNGKWSVVPCNIKGAMLETGDRNFRYDTEEAALTSIPKDFIEIEHELMPIIFGDSYRRVFVKKQDMDDLEIQNEPNNNV